VADLLGYLGDLSVHRLLVGGHRIELGIQVVDGLIKCLIGLGLGSDKELCEALQV